MKFVAGHFPPDPSSLYQYPEHLRDQLTDLPQQPGVYFFYGESEKMPLYVGKSINLRQRIRSHLRNTDNAKMLRLARHIRWITTAGELGALLLEAQMVKTLQPLFNKRLRKNRQLCSLQITEQKISVVYAKDLDFSITADLYGLYANRQTALQHLRKIADKQRLCYLRLGLEKCNLNRGCFRASLGRCAGVCSGKESVQAHQQRLMNALERVKMKCWPWRGPVGLVEQGKRETAIHIIDHWFYLGSVSDISQADRLHTSAKGFDQDGYKLLCYPLLSGQYPVIPLTSG